MTYRILQKKQNQKLTSTNNWMSPISPMSNEIGIEIGIESLKLLLLDNRQWENVSEQIKSINYL